MSASVDFTISSAKIQDKVNGTLTHQQQRESSLESIDASAESNETVEGSNAYSQDSGVALNFSASFRDRLSKPAPPQPAASTPGAAGGLINFRRSHGPANLGGTPLCDLRRPSIVDMVNNGGIFITQGGTCEINFDNVNATDLEQLYADAHVGQRRGSCSGPSLGYSGSKELEDLCDSSWMQKSSLGGSSEHLSLHSDKYECLNTSRYWWSPKFNSEVLEERLKKTVIEFLRRRFRVALVLIGMFTLLWIVVFSVNIPFYPTNNSTLSKASLNNKLAISSVSYSLTYVFGGLTLFICIGILLVITFTQIYAKFALSLSVLFSLILMCCSFALAVSPIFSNEDVQGFLTLSFLAQFAVTAVFILVVFTLSRLPTWLSVVLSVIYLIILEGLIGFAIYGKDNSSTPFPQRVYINSSIGRVVLYIGLILAGVTTSYMLQVRQLATFWKIAQCVLSQKALDLERELEEKTILSMMPKHFADRLLSVQVQMAFMIKQRAVQESQGSLDPLYQSISAPFNICSKDNVSILFADIVDFTKFSSTLSAAELVGILNNVFCMFDELVTKHKCEKISTLGDCYFCVSGCPEPEPKHADNCVNMGLAIIEALEDYRKRTNRMIEMRVGIHTGSVFCGVMGTKRFKFDVWSGDVTIANKIESASSPGKVLISKATHSLLSGSYVLEPSELQLSNMELFYVMGQKAARAQISGLSGSEWKKRINTIDTVCKSEGADEASFRRESTSSIKNTTQLLCPWWKRENASVPRRKSLADQHSSSSIMDIQTKLQRCTSYADLAVPHNKGEEEKQNVDIDKDIVMNMEKQKVHFDTYFDPQLHILSLTFHDHNWESTYRNYGRDLDDGSNGELTEMELGYRITKLSYVLDTLALFVTFLVIMIGSAVCLNSDGTFYKIWHAWLGIFLFGLAVEITVLVFVFAVFSPQWFPKRFAKLATIIINWYVRSLVALFFIYYPMTIVGVSISQCQATSSSEAHLARLAHVQMTFFVTIVVLVSSITFMEVSHIVKFVGGFLSAFFAVIMVLVVSLTLCIKEIPDTPTIATAVSTEALGSTTDAGLRGPVSDLSLSEYFTTYYSRHVAPEAVILLLLILILLAVVNRMSEVSVRLSFIGRIEASARRRFTRQHKIQAEWLLFNIIPPHVAYKLRTTGTFSQNHECVGVMFASIVNFQEFLHKDENKGEDSLRFLNVIISEFDTLLERQRFTNVEKIKTIGSTYMAASGLSLPPEECHSVTHLLDLIEFGNQLMEILKVLNSKVTDFVFEMQIGFNYGSVTSGVVGSRKMLYDIWGDTVNVASRMATTGTVNEIHMPQECLEKLGSHVKTHAVHDLVHVKGKGEMKTVFIRLNAIKRLSKVFM